MSAVKFLEEKGIYGLDTKKRYNEVIAWMEEYAASKSTPAEDWVKVEDAKFTYAEMMELAGYMASADCNTPIEKLKKDAELHISNQLAARLHSPPKK